MTAANKDFFEALSMLEHERGITPTPAALMWH